MVVVYSLFPNVVAAEGIHAISMSKGVIYRHGNSRFIRLACTSLFTMADPGKSAQQAVSAVTLLPAT